MTKRLVRVSALSLLNPSSGDLCWDLGAGTGSVSVELSARCRRVISVEKDPAALALLRENKERFGAWNMEIVKGEIPEVLSQLPYPDRIFVGGGGRWIRAVLDDASQKCAEGRKKRAVLITAVTLETLQEAVSALEEHGYETEIVQAAVTNILRQGQFHMMHAHNPVFLILGSAG
jgi:precorrin-6Y C5,15-methyltransferase (decarboxylating)